MGTKKFYQTDLPDHSDAFIWPPLIYAGGVVATYGLHWLWPWRIAPTAWPESAALIPVSLGVLLIGFAVFQFHRADTTVHPWQPTIALVTHGVYRYTRNPIYLGLSLIYLGIGCALNTVWILITLAGVAIILQEAVIQREEEYLMRKFGSEYEDYRNRVGRWF